MAKCQTAVSSLESGSITTISAARYTSRSTSCNEGNAPPLPTGPRPVKYSSSTMIVAAVSHNYANFVTDDTAPPLPYRPSVPTSRFRSSTSNISSNWDLLKPMLHTKRGRLIVVVGGTILGLAVLITIIARLSIRHQTEQTAYPVSDISTKIDATTLPATTLTTALTARPTTSIAEKCTALRKSSGQDISFVLLDNQQLWVMQHDGCSLNNSRTVLTYSLASTTQVVAVKLTNTIINGRVHGLLGSMPDGRIVTDDTWKCTAHLNQSSETKWMKASYNDSLWPNAVIQETQCDWLIRNNRNDAFDNITHTAAWIWARDHNLTQTNHDNTSTATMYCRKVIGLVFASVGDDDHWIYADGKLVGESHRWNKVVYSNIHVSTRVIAIKLSNNGGFGGVVGSLSDGLTVTDDTWKCTTTLHDKWNQVDFDDSSWSQATPMAQLQGATDGRAAHKALATNAKWIWTEEQQPPFKSTPNTTIYCRKRR